MTIRDNIQTIGERIRAAEQRFGREPGSVRLLAVSKKHPAATIREAFAAGQTLFGENYVQEMVEKSLELSAAGIEWHFIGPIQSNKTRLIAATARWVHSVDSFKVAKRLSRNSPMEGVWRVAGDAVGGVQGQDPSADVKGGAAWYFSTPCRA